MRERRSSPKPVNTRSLRLEAFALASALLVAASSRDATPDKDSIPATARNDSTMAAPRRDSLVVTPPTAAADPSGDSPAADGAVQVTEHGVGPLKIGMTLADARKATSGAVTAPPAADTAVCGFARWNGAPAGVRLMTAKGRIVRVDVDSGSTTTAAGAHIGDSESRIKTLYAGRVETVPSKYTKGHDLTVKRPAAADSTYRFIFETDGKRVTKFRAGRMPEVGYAEGCG